MRNTPIAPHKNSGKGKRPKRGVMRRCTFDACRERAYADNLYCPKHQWRADRHGDPSIVLKRGRKRKGGTS